VWHTFSAVAAENSFFYFSLERGGQTSRRLMMGDSPLCEQQQWVVKQQPVANESAAAMLIQLVIALLAPYSR